jgi:hypothetical protein
VLTISFTIFLDPKYHQVKVGDETTLPSLSIGLGKVI